MSDKFNKKGVDRVDPDPFIIAGLLIGGCGLILQLVQIAQNSNKINSSIQPVNLNNNQLNVIDHLRTSTLDVRNEVEQLIRYIDRGSNDPENEFYEARFRLNQVSLFLDPPSYDQFSRSLVKCYSKMGQLSSWINHIIIHQNDLAIRLGYKLEGPLEGMDNHLNNVIETGKTTRFILQEMYRATNSLLEVLDEEERRRN